GAHRVPEERAYRRELPGDRRLREALVMEPRDETPDGECVDRLGARNLLAVTLGQESAKLRKVARVGAQRLLRNAPLILQVREESRDGAVVGGFFLHSARSASAPSSSVSSHAVRDAMAFAERARRRSSFRLEVVGASGRRPNAAFCG